GCAGCARIVAGDREAAAERLASRLEAAHVVALPAVQADRDFTEAANRLIRVDAHRCVLLLRQPVCLLDCAHRVSDAARDCLSPLSVAAPKRSHAWSTVIFTLSKKHFPTSRRSSIKRSTGHICRDNRGL